PPEHQQDGLRVVGYEQACHPRAFAFVLSAAGVLEFPFRGGRPSRAIGSTKLKVAPSPGLELAEIEPPWTSTSDLAMARPRPVPPTSCVSPLSARQKRSNTWSS